MNLKEALAALMDVQHQLAVVDYLLSELEDLLPDDTGERVKEPLIAPNALPETVPDSVVVGFIEKLTEERNKLVDRLTTLQNMETKDGKRKRT